MKKHLNLILIAAIAICGAASAFAYDENTDSFVGGSATTDNPGPLSMNRALVFSGTYDFADETYDTNDIIKLVSVPDGILIDKIVVTARDLDQVVTNTLYKYSSSAWASEDSAVAYSASTDASTVYHFLTPTYQNPQATNPVVEIADDTIAASLAGTSWGFINTLSTNGAPTEGTITISVLGYDVAPVDRE